MKTKLFFCCLGLLFMLSTTNAQAPYTNKSASRVETVPAEYFYNKLGLKLNPRLGVNNLMAVSKSSNGLRINNGFKLVRVPVPSNLSRQTVYAVIPAEYRTIISVPTKYETQKVSQSSAGSKRNKPVLSKSKDAAVFSFYINWGEVAKFRQVGNTLTCAQRECKLVKMGPRDKITGNGALILVPNYTY